MPITITLELRELLDALWGMKPCTRVEPPFAIKLREADPEGSLCHVEWEPEDGPHAVVWRLKDWATEYEKYLKDKASAEVRVAVFNKRKEAIIRIAVVLKNILGLEDSMIDFTANKLYDEHNIVAIKSLTGIEMKPEDFV